MEEEDDHSSLSGQLLCQEPETTCLDEEETIDGYTFVNSINCVAVSETEDDEYIQILLDREITVGFQRRDSDTSDIVIDNWIKCSRFDAITWILKTRALLGFRFQTAYLSVIYFDRFLSRRTIDKEKNWAIRLLSLACLTLATKMEESRVPALSEFPAAEEYKFESRVVQRMELLVLDTLEWKMGSVTPFAYLHYFITNLCKYQSPPPKNIICTTSQLILCITRDVNLMGHRPSVIAAAATILAVDQTLTRQAFELKINVISPSGFLEISDVFRCYNLMQELEMGKVTIPKCIISPDLSLIRFRDMDASENSTVTCALGTKRKRLPFSDCDQNCQQQRK